MKYSAKWWTAILASIALHVLAAIFFILVLPKILPAQKVPSVTEMNWVDVELVDEVTAFDDEIVAIEPAESESSTDFEFAPIELPPLEIPIFEPPPLPEIAAKPAEPPAPFKDEPPPKEESPKDNAEKPEQDEPAEITAWVEKPIVISAVYPAESFGYTGEVMILATIGRDGKVKQAELVFPTGNSEVDAAAQVAAEQWTFKPALDKDGKPTECSYSIIFNFKKIFPDG